jgi:NRPS condensation-like uncharacterized protein
MNARVRFKSENIDLVQYLYGEFKYNDHQIHCVIKFDTRISATLFRQAFLLSLEAVPILSSRFVLNNRRPYWERIDKSDCAKGFLFVETEDPDSEVNRFLTSRTDELAGPQIMVTIVRHRQGDILCVVLNHMVCDAAGLKQYLHLLNDIYCGLENNSSYLPPFRNDGSRSLYQVYRQFPLIKRVRMLCLSPDSKKSPITLAQNTEQSQTVPVKSFVSIFKFPESRYTELKKYCVLHNITINDAVSAAYFRTVYRLLETKKDTVLNIPCTVDLRRYLLHGKEPAICNLSSWISMEVILKEPEGQSSTCRARG